MEKNSEGETVRHKINTFSLTDQTGQEITNAAVKGKVYVANFFFVACPSICPKMTRNLRLLQDAYHDEDRFAIISHTVDPIHDSVARLQLYGEKNRIDAYKWHLLTGDKKQIYLLARNDYEVSISEGDGGPTDFIHSELLVLVDDEGYIRGYADGTDENAVNHLKKDIDYLLKNKQ